MSLSGVDYHRHYLSQDKNVFEDCTAALNGDLEALIAELPHSLWVAEFHLCTTSKLSLLLAA
jgi:hypothetical protein